MKRIDTLAMAVRASHDSLHDLLQQARVAAPDLADPRQHFRRIDTFLATLSRHLAAVEDEVYPLLRDRLPDGRPTVGGQVRLVHRLERVMLMLEGSLYGDSYARGIPRDDVWDELIDLLDEHIRTEEPLAGRLDDMLDAAGRARLVAAYEIDTHRAPTRPHPYSPHANRLGRVTHRVWSLVDRARDEMDSRIIPRQRAKPHGRPDSLLTRYLLGSPTFDEQDPAREPPT